MNIFKNILNKIKVGFSDILYPKHIKCIFCGDELVDLNNFDCCDNCFKTLPFISEDCCLRCGNQMSEDSLGVCKNCKANNFSFDFARSVFNYEKNLIPVIHKLKYASAKYLAEPLAYFLYVKYVNLNWDIDVITSVPLHENRAKDRGYNQAREMAKELSKLVGVKYVELAERRIDNPSQTSLDIKDRKKNVKDIFRLKNEKIKGKNILLIDDVYTTGATTNELSKLFKNANANKVYVLTLAHSVLKDVE